MRLFGGGCQAAWFAASRGLADQLDGPERALFRRADEAEQQGRQLLVAVRAVADRHHERARLVTVVEHGDLGRVSSAAGAAHRAACTTCALERLLAITEKSPGPDHPQTADMFDNLAELDLEVGDLSASEALETRALAIREKVFGAIHLDVATSLIGLADVYAVREDLELAERALTIQDASESRADHMLVRSLGLLALAHLGRGETAAARPLLRSSSARRRPRAALSRPSTRTWPRSTPHGLTWRCTRAARTRPAAPAHFAGRDHQGSGLTRRATG